MTDECIATGDPDLHECSCRDCREERAIRDDLDEEMHGERSDW